MENKKTTFLACIAKQVYAAILESSENCDIFHNRQTYICKILEISLAWFRSDKKEAKISRDGGKVESCIYAGAQQILFT